MRTEESVKYLIMGIISTMNISVDDTIKIAERLIEALRDEGNLIIPDVYSKNE